MKKKFEVELELGRGPYWILGNGWLKVFDPDSCDSCEHEEMGLSITKIEEEKEMISGIDKVKLSAPWYTLLHEYEALFGEDEDISMGWREDDGDLYIDLRVRNSEKADALTRLLPNEYKLGNSTVYVKVIPTNTDTSNINLFCKAFKGNPVVSRVVSKSDAMCIFDRNYVVFKNKVVQFFNDSLTDINGNLSVLYEDIAREIFKSNADGIFFSDHIYFCTEGESK